MRGLHWNLGFEMDVVILSAADGCMFGCCVGKQ